MLQDYYYRHLMMENNDVIEHYRREKIDLSRIQKRETVFNRMNEVNYFYGSIW